jgi:hypothetical protein
VNAEGRPNEGDRVRVTYEGEVEAVTGKSFRIRGLWHYISRPDNATPQIEVVEPALEKGWHRVFVKGDISLVGTVVARHWDGKAWGSAEQSHPTERDAYRSIEFLGGGSDE